MLDILRIVQDGATKTEIVYRANLNFLMAEHYLSSLVKSGLVYVQPGYATRLYKIAEKGRNLMKALTEVQTELRGLLTQTSKVPRESALAVA